MGFKSLILTLSCLIAYCSGNGSRRSSLVVQDGKTYRAAVVTLPGVEIPDPTTDRLNSTLLENNVEIYEKYIAEAGKKKVDILVFPEATLNYFGLVDKETARKFAVTLPSVEEKITPCDGRKYNKILARLCKAVKLAKVYTVINVVEKVNCTSFKNTCGGPVGPHEDTNVFNTNIVMDRNGMIIARYRKINLFSEPLMDPTKEVGMEPFSTDFGEKFFTIICFDLIFKTPTFDVITKKGVKNIILTTMWFSKAPFFVAPQAQMGFAVANKVNLIAACGMWIDHGGAGSGIYSVNHGYLKMALSDTGRPEMLVSDLPKALALDSSNVRGNLEGTDSVKEMKKKITFKNELTKLAISQHPFPIIDADFAPIKEHHSFCTVNDKNIKICCKYEAKFTKYSLARGQTGYHYYFASFGGVRKFGGGRMLSEIFCAVVACTGNNPKKDCGQRYGKEISILHKTVDFESITVSMTIEAKNSVRTFEDILIMPSTLNVGMLPLQLNQYKFSSTTSGRSKTNVITTQNNGQLYTFGFYGRNFNDDVKVS